MVKIYHYNTLLKLALPILFGCDYKKKNKITHENYVVCVIFSHQLVFNHTERDFAPTHPQIKHCGAIDEGTKKSKLPQPLKSHFFSVLEGSVGS